MNSLLSEIHNVAQFFKCILEVLVFTGLAIVPISLLGHELAKRRVL